VPAPATPPVETPAPVEREQPEVSADARDTQASPALPAPSAGQGETAARIAPPASSAEPIPARVVETIREIAPIHIVEHHDAPMAMPAAIPAPSPLAAVPLPTPAGPAVPAMPDVSDVVRAGPLPAAPVVEARQVVSAAPPLPAAPSPVIADAVAAPAPVTLSIDRIEVRIVPPPSPVAAPPRRRETPGPALADFLAGRRS